MRRREGHIRQRSEGSWELRYPLGTDPATGRRRTVTATVVRGPRKAAEKELRRLLKTLDDNEHVDPTRMSVAQWLRVWLEVVRAEVSPKTYERYHEVAENFLVPELGALVIGKLAPIHIQKAYSKWATTGRRDGKEGGLSPRTRRHLHRILKTALTRAVEQQVVARNPADALKKRLPKVERRSMTTLSTEQAAELLRAIGHTRVYWPTLLALATGADDPIAKGYGEFFAQQGLKLLLESKEPKWTSIRAHLGRRIPKAVDPNWPRLRIVVGAPR